MPTFSRMLRLLLLVAGSWWTGVAAAQSCILVADPHGVPVPGTVVHDHQGQALGRTDAFGRFCPARSADTLVLQAPGFLPLRIAWADAFTAGHVQLTPAPDGTVLAAVPIRPWPSPRDRQALAAVSSMDSLELHRYDPSSMRGALLWAPGVQMDERGHGGSTRLSMRGSLLRSPYGVRGVKVYWGPFSLTLADGSTPLELLDPELVGSLDVVRSIGGPVFGSAPSGLLLAQPPERGRPGHEASVAGMGGPDGYFKLSGTLRTRQANGNALSVGVLRLGNDGYRAQEYARRDQAWLVQRLALPKGNVRIFLTAQKAAWGLPGSLDSLTAAQDPRAARPYSQLIDARVEKAQLFGGIAVEQRVWQGLLLRSSVQVQAINKVNPYGTSPFFGGHKDERIRSAGTRLSLGSTIRRKSVALAWELGLEALVQRDQLLERIFEEAVPTQARTDADTRASNLNGFLSTRLLLGPRTTVFADLGTEATAFHHHDGLRGLDTRIAPATELYPLIGLERVLGERVVAHLRYAQSTSRPTIWEVLGTAGVPNASLAAERVEEAEAGLGFQGKRAGLSVNGYLRRTDGLILAERVNDGTEEVFNNAGAAAQHGVELAGRSAWDLPGSGRLALLLNAAWQHHQLALPGGTRRVDVPGIPRWAGGARVRGSFPRGQVELGWRALSTVAASSTNGDRLPGHGVVQLHAGRHWAWKAHRLHLGATVENLLDARYTSFLQLNDPAGRYYNPAPGRSFFLTLRINFAGTDEATTPTQTP